MTYEDLTDKNIENDDSLNKISGLLEKWHAEVGSIERFGFRNDQRVYYAVNCHIPDYTGKQNDDGYDVSWGFEGFDVVKIIEVKNGFHDFYDLYDEIEVFYDKMRSLKRDENGGLFACSSGIPYQAEKSDKTRFNKITRIFSEIFID